VKQSSTRTLNTQSRDKIDIIIADDSATLNQKILSSLQETLPDDALAIDALKDMLDVTAPSSSSRTSLTKSSQTRTNQAALSSSNKEFSGKSVEIESMRPGPKGAMTTAFKVEKHENSDVNKFPAVINSVGGSGNIARDGKDIDPVTLDFDFLAAKSLTGGDAETNGDASAFDDFDAVFVSADTTSETVSTPSSLEAAINSPTTKGIDFVAAASAPTTKETLSDAAVRFLKSLPNLNFVLE
jgi:hypothetical protein